MTQRLRKNGKPRKEYMQKKIAKPKPLCTHLWRLNDSSKIPKCMACQGEAIPGTVHYATAIVMATMASDRGTVRRSYPERSNYDD